MRTASEVQIQLDRARDEVKTLEAELQGAWLSEAKVPFKVGDRVRKKTGKNERAIVASIVARGADWIEVKGSKLKKDGKPSKAVVRLGSVGDLVSDFEV